MEDIESFISDNLDRYENTQGLNPLKLESMGDKYEEQGYFTQNQLYEVAYTSSTRSAHYVRENSEEKCREITGNISNVQGDYSKMHLITGLSGFKPPTASCILTAIDDKRHAVVDTRVWASLERIGFLDERKETFNSDDYITMIEYIRDISENVDYTTAEIGYALFAYDDFVREGTLH